MSKSVADAMTERPHTISRRATAVEAAKAMLDDDVGSLPVLDDDGFLAGIITDRDIALRVVAAGRDPNTTTMEEIATPEPHAAGPEESLDEAVERMAAWRIRRLPVVENGQIVGILSQADLVHEVKDRKAGQLVDEISQPGQVAYGRQEVGIS
jgi:CBS domain-containing protein